MLFKNIPNVFYIYVAEIHDRDRSFHNFWFFLAGGKIFWIFWKNDFNSDGFRCWHLFGFGFHFVKTFFGIYASVGWHCIRSEVLILEIIKTYEKFLFGFLYPCQGYFYFVHSFTTFKSFSIRIGRLYLIS